MIADGGAHVISGVGDTYSLVSGDMSNYGNHNPLKNLAEAISPEYGGTVYNYASAGLNLAGGAMAVQQAIAEGATLAAPVIQTATEEAGSGLSTGVTDEITVQQTESSASNDGLWKPGTDVTEQQIRNAMQDADLNTQQQAISLPAVTRYAQRLANGETPPAIKVDNGIIVDGNHRYVAGRVAGIEVPQTPYVGGRPSDVVNWEDVFVDPSDWGNH